MSVTPGLLAQTAAATQSTLAPFAGADWQVRAGDLDWSCWQTGVHLADDYFSYACQVQGQPPESYVPIEVSVPAEAGAAGLLAAISVCAGLLGAAATLADPAARAFHPDGNSDPYGFVAMGMVEGLVHTYDIARGLGSDWRPPAELCVPVLQRLFPDAPDGDPTDVLLWCTGRAALGDKDRLAQWRWWSEVPA
ncbi:MAG: hypothetical protein QOF39_154 [Frankiales bacterium]|jgi:hypothetical protein|nr:hypothetical protein [Frankiales bacterium]